MKIGIEGKLFFVPISDTRPSSWRRREAVDLSNCEEFA
jgi:hypothetical protein